MNWLTLGSLKGMLDAPAPLGEADSILASDSLRIDSLPRHRESKSDYQIAEDVQALLDLAPDNKASNWRILYTRPKRRAI